MPDFTYKAKSTANAVVDGIVNADSQQAAVVKILQLGQTPILVEPATATQHIASDVANFSKLVRSGVSTSSLAFFSRSLGDLLDAGVPLLGALELLAKQPIAPILKNVIFQMVRSVTDGASLSRALSEHPQIFNNLYVSMVRASEASGNLSRILLVLGQNLEKEVGIKNRIQSALLYPMIILGVGVVAIFVLLTFVLPKLSVMFDDFGAELPVPTKMVVALSNFLAHFWWAILIGVIALTIYFVRYSMTSYGNFQLSKIALKIPIVNDFIRAVHIARYTRTLAVLLESGVAITQALESSVTVLENAIFIEQARSIAAQVRLGTSLSVAVKSASAFGDLTANLIAVGEQGGRLEGNLYKIATIHEEQSQQMTETSLNALGPIILIAVVLIVGAMMFSIILPLIKMNMIIK